MQTNGIFRIDFEKLHLGLDRYITPAGRILDSIDMLLDCETRSNIPEIRILKREIWSSIAQELGLGVDFFSRKPSFNKRASKWFAGFDSRHKTHGKFATWSRGQEHRVLGYSLDYFNPDLRLIIEWDEEHHFIGDNLKQEDVNRQKQILRVYRNFTFLRIRQKHFDDERFGIIDQEGCTWIRKKPYLEAVNKANSITTK